ncbi:CDP-diacylglycerol--serine O-phosphatidyltransferase [Psychrosphaera aquimarina]|uniref:CDP-diacylglycerol--serine O-phosphatidyltransferase n=1 Tax=Psychrosphaera aquimarina TaxID=2044854 RepID=A0ABU3QZA6_9GAMM|nr:CDP-diacylglycerol--serine O-phosphatidyltransferase [Psychrosphaera aquimarina]MDU0112755.1 CDP-diacylglycerol--serine O-phosphatidyltransferase [Psychrosphaera aquimarina]
MTNKSDSPTTTRRGIYLLPNLLTTAGLFSGFFAVVSSMNGNFEAAAVAIFVAMIFDGLDGRVARMTNTQSEFGAEYDSMADIVSFGVAPALVTYNFALNSLGKFGWLASFIFVACAALRLARFNTQIGVADGRYFQGLASPAAAAVIAATVWTAVGFEIDGHDYGVYLAIITVVTGLLMVSNFRYSSFKEIEWRGKVPFVAVLVIVLVFTFVAARPAEVLLAVFGLYALSGPIITIKTVKKLKLEHVVGDDTETDADFNDKDKKD